MTAVIRALKSLKILYWFLLLVPAAAIAHLAHAPAAIVFILAAGALIPLSGLLGKATEELAGRIGDSWGGLLNATFGNAAELIIVIVALKAGLLDLAKASIAGSVLGNLLFVLGASLVVAGWRVKEFTFTRELVWPSITNLFIAMTAMGIPTVAHFTMGDALNEKISLGASAVLLGLYAMMIVRQFRYPSEGVSEIHEAVALRWSVKLSLAVLAISAAAIVGLSEILVHHIEDFCKEIGLTETFVGLVIVPIIGNVAEHFVAIQVALKRRMNLSLAISIGSAVQIGLFVAPVAVFTALLFGHELDLYFPPIALIGVGASVFITSCVIQDAKSNWFEGVQLLGLYAILGWAFYLI